MLELQKMLLDKDDARLYLSRIFSILLTGMKKISNDTQNLEMILPSLRLVEQILKTFMGLDHCMTLSKQKSNPNFRAAIENFNELYVQISRKLI